MAIPLPGMIRNPAHHFDQVVDHSTAASFQNKLQQRHHPRIVDSFGYLLEKQVMPNLIKAGLEIHIDDSGFVLDHCLGYQVDCRLGSPLGSIAIRPSLRRFMQPSPYGRGFGLRGYSLAGPPLRSLSLRPGDSLTIPWMALSMGFRYSVSLLPAIQATGSL
jgi:hypothetical protein